MDESTDTHEFPRKTNSNNSSSKSINKRGRKRKRRSSDSSNEDIGNLPANSLEVEQSLQATAAKNNINDTGMKKLLKKVVLNDHVLAIVKLREEEGSEDEEDNLSVKLTRSKTKQLKNWELTPIKRIPVKTRPEVKALIAQELPDESDEEYSPTHDDIPSDEDQTLESCSDIESQPRTPATPRSQPSASPKQCVTDGPFKVPQELKASIKSRLEIEEATIALRTRSKLSLSETPIEHIEQSFVPPDEPPATVVDDLWNKFLEECLDPAPSFRNEDDDETDPEYNVAADPDAQDEDEEALENSLIKISKKELTDLMSELMTLMPEDVDIQTENIEQVENFGNHSQLVETIGKHEPVSDEQTEITFETSEAREFRRNSLSIGKSEPLSDEENLTLCNEEESDNVTVENRISKEAKDSENNCQNSENFHSSKTDCSQNTVTEPRDNSIVMINLQERTKTVTHAFQEPVVPTVLKNTLQKDLENHKIEIRFNPTTDELILPEQVQIFQQQLRQHIQLCTSNFLQLFVHPIHWKLAPKYKQYLETFMKLKENKAKSVVDVCNLDPAMELVNSWEKSVSENTSENIEMIKFLQKETEMSNRRLAQNAVYIGKFHPTFLQAIANSHVFLYPYLLPAVPFRTMKNRKNAYLRSEDELMACGLDQFWQYVIDNPALFKLPSRSHECRRYGLTHVIDLMRRYMFPWLSNSTIQAHINHIRRLHDPVNPINLFFSKREIVPVKHKLLSFNPNITLYEQPDHEMPLIWLRYIKSMSQKRFVSSRVKIQGVEPQGVEVKIGKTVEPVKKLPLPKDFTKMFKRNKHNKMVTISQKPSDDYNPIQIHINTNTTQNENTSTTSVTVTSTTMPAPQKVTNLFNLVQTSVGAYLIPLTVVQSTTVVNSVQTPITTPNHDSTVANNKIPDDELVNKRPNLSSTIHFSDDDTSESDEPNKSKIPNVRTAEKDCCKCCNIYRSYIKRQSKITEYFLFDNQRSEVPLCPCQQQRLHRTNVTNRLKLLVQSYRVCSFSVWRHLDEKISKLISKSKDDGMKDKKSNDQTYCDILDGSENADCKYKSADYDSLKDIGFVNIFLMKILSGSATLKKLMSNHLTKFDPESDSPVYLFNKLSSALKGEDFQITKDFVQFLTPEQALKVNRFGTYLLVSITPLLISRIEEDVTENEVKISLLSELSSLCSNVGEFSPCNMCEKLLGHTKNYRKLTELIFSLFPHRRKSNANEKLIDKIIDKEQTTEKEQQASQIESNNENTNDGTGSDAVISEKNDGHLSPKPCTENQNDFLSDSSDDDSPLRVAKVENENESSDGPEDNDIDLESVGQIEDSKNLEYDNGELLGATKTESISSRRDSEESMVYASDSESMKYEIADWTRDEDKVVLEILKDTLTPTEMKDKTILEILEEKNVFVMLANSLEHKSAFDIRDRVLYLLDVLNKTAS